MRSKKCRLAKTGQASTLKLILKKCTLNGVSVVCMIDNGSDVSASRPTLAQAHPKKFPKKVKSNYDLYCRRFRLR